MTTVPRLLPVPASAWVLGWGCLATQVLAIAERGVHQNQWLGYLLSVAFGAVVILWFSDGVLRMRTGRRFVVWLILVFAAYGEVARLTDAAGDDDGWAALQLATSVVVIGALLTYQRSDFAAAARVRGSESRAPLTGVLWLAAVVGALGGLTPPPG